MKRKSPQKFTDNFKREAVNLVVEQSYTVPQAAETKTHHENQAEMKKDVLDYLHYYNLTRLHTANNDLTPVEYEMAFVKVSDFS
ncbi:transposase [Xenorhabdus bovienii str. oregonense]|uniref:Transposase n=1 Tax=Xenorhabdus bovienii str. oregonense TaxID=1398202 RepID=A0A077P8P3_XENBV|nr:IS3 family transposase [Xenorhabdus bovienii]CDH06978.1 transposase [Xenorhabdus bovienii str. oregonense]